MPMAKTFIHNINGRFFDLPTDGAMVKRIQKVVADAKGCDTLLVLGIGGSDLGARALIQALKPKKRVLFAGGNTDPDELADVIGTLIADLRTLGYLG